MGTQQIGALSMAQQLTPGSGFSVEEDLAATREAPRGRGDPRRVLEREELIGDEIEEIMAELGEREPLSVPVGGAGQSGNGQPGDGQTPVT